MDCTENLPEQDTKCRNRIIFRTSWLNVVVNLLMSAVKITIGLLTNSIAIVSEGVNNASDMATSVITMVGTKLSQKRPTKQHPFGYGRIEYLTSLLIGLLILFTGVELLKSSIDQIRHPEELKVNYVSLGILLVSLVIKLLLGCYSIAMGKKANCKALIAVGQESRSDSIVSAITILSAVIFLIFHTSVDGWAGILTSLFVLKAAWDVLKDTIAALLGQPTDKELADKLYEIIRATPGVLNAVDMTLHNYGPNAHTGSVNIEIDHSRTIGDVYQVIHDLQLRIMHEYHVTMVFGMYAVNRDEPELRDIRKNIVQFIRETDHVLSTHALYLTHDKNELYCDFIVDYQLRNWEELRAAFLSYMKKLYPSYNVILTIETEFV